MSNGDFAHQTNFWTHGVNTIVEYPERVQSIQHAGWGTLVRQAGGTENWFHIPLHAPHAIPSGPQGESFPRPCEPYWARLGGAILKAQLNERAVIAETHLRAGQRLLASQRADYRGMEVRQVITTLSPERTYPIFEEDGVTLCVKVLFLAGDPVGQVIFVGAGSYFNHA